MTKKLDKSVKDKGVKHVARTKSRRTGSKTKDSMSNFGQGKFYVIILSIILVALAVVFSNSSNLAFLKNLLWGKSEDISRIAQRREQRPIDLNVSKGIDRRSNLSLEEFINLYDAKWPVLITDAMKYWPAMKKWNKNFFIKKYGDERITFKGVQGNIANRQGLSSPLKVFLDHIHMSSPDIWTYLEDEIFLLKHKELRSDIGTPVYLKEDFFALLPQEIRPWNAMLLWGTAFSRSTLHIDPYNWTGTNAVIKGRKAWKLYPPGQDHLLYAEGRGLSGFPLDCHKYQSPVDTFALDKKQFPLAAKAKAVEFVQLPGELLIIPTGWFHQAFNEEETMAVSSQVMNTQNYKLVLEEILKVGNVRPQDMPRNLEGMEPREQVKRIFAKLPKRIIDKGREVTKDILRKLQNQENTKLYFS